MRGSRIGLLSALTVLVLAVVFAFWGRRRNETGNGREILSACRLDALSRQADKPTGIPKTADDRSDRVSDAGDCASGDEETISEVAEEEKLVDAFDNLTDKWMEPSAKGVTMADVVNFAKTFRRVPRDRQDECIHRALNLVPDGNVMLLAGLLMDKSVDRAIAETVYNDILNRDEDVKKPILQQIFRDKSHPCWADTAWILEVTGELPKTETE